MIAILSPAKNIDITPHDLSLNMTRPLFESQANALAQHLGTLSISDLADLYKSNLPIAELNYNRLHHWQTSPVEEQLRSAAFAFNGEVYRGLDIKSMNPQQLEFCDGHIRLLSGLYGVLRPLDGIQAYRLEMGTKLPFESFASLYDVWRERVTDVLCRDIESSSGDKVLINLASAEYSKVVNRKKLPFRVIEMDFKQEENGKLKNVTVYAKRARGLMARFMSVYQIERADDLKAFDSDGYVFDSHHSSHDLWVFIK